MENVQKLWGVVVTKTNFEPQEYEFIAATGLDDEAYKAIASLIADGDAYLWAIDRLKENLNPEKFYSTGDCSESLNIGLDSFIIEAFQFDLDKNPEEFTDEIGNLKFTDKPLKKGDTVYMWVDVNEIGGIFSSCVDEDMCIPLKLV